MTESQRKAALEILISMRCYCPDAYNEERQVQYESGQILSDHLETIIEALQAPQPEEVTVEELAEVMHLEVCDNYLDDFNFLADKYPHGIRIIREKS